MVKLKMHTPRSSLKILVTLGFVLVATVIASCGVKKAPDVYYKHPMEFGDFPSPTPAGGNP